MLSQNWGGPHARTILFISLDASSIIVAKLCRACYYEVSRPYPQYGWDFLEEIPEKKKNSGKTPETLSELFLELPSRVQLGTPKPYNSMQLKPPEHFQNSPPQYGWGRLFFRKCFRSGPLRAGHGIPSSTDGMSEYRATILDTLQHGHVAMWRVLHFFCAGKGGCDMGYCTGGISFFHANLSVSYVHLTPMTLRADLISRQLIPMTFCCIKFARAMKNYTSGIAWCSWQLGKG